MIIVFSLQLLIISLLAAVILAEESVRELMYELDVVLIQEEIDDETFDNLRRLVWHHYIAHKMSK